MSLEHASSLPTSYYLESKWYIKLNQILDVIHPDLANVSKDKLKDIISKKYKVDARSYLFIIDIVLFGFKTAFGGGRSTGFCLIYDAH